MRRKLIITLLLLSGLVSAQASLQVEKPQFSAAVATDLGETKFAEVRSRLGTSLPFQLGEQLTYEMKLSRFPIYGTIGTLTFTVNEGQMQTATAVNNDKPATDTSATATSTSTSTSPPATTAESATTSSENNKNPLWKFVIDINSKGILTSLFRIKVNDEYTSYVDKSDFGVIKTIKKIEEGKRRRENIADFDRQQRKVKWIDTDLNSPMKATQTKEKDTFNWVTDIVSGWYVLRAQQLTVGKSLVLPISDNGETYEISVDVLEKEQFESELGKFSTLKVEMKIFGGKIIKRKGRLFVWVTDDQRHLPVRAQIKSNFGTVTGTLIEMKSVKPVETERPPQEGKTGL
ncbi:MAG: DUF3108 domain-containing protein [Acidobacteriota bacterium]